MRKTNAIAFLILLVPFVFGAIILRKVSLNSSHDQNPIDVKSLTGLYDQTQTQGVFHGQKVASAEISDKQLAQRVLGFSDEPKRIEVDLSTQHLLAYEGSRVVYDFLVSTGKWGRTPTGTFRIWSKYRYTKMSGGNVALHTYYYLPNVPYVMFFSGDGASAASGFSLHGTYWHNNFGHPMSHGCVNMRTEDAGVLFYWAQPNLGDKKSITANTDNPGTEVRIYGEAPNE